MLRRPVRLALPAAAFALLALGFPTLGQDGASFVPSAEAKGACPDGMSRIKGKYCIDRYEASVEEIVGPKKTKPHSPFASVAGLKVKAVSKKGVKPQGYISRDEAEEACQNAGKRLCTDEEWLTACKGKKPTLWPYGDDHKDGVCNDHGESSFNHYYGQGGGEPPKEAYSWENMNDPRLNQYPGGLALTGHFKKCKNGFDVYDMVGNLHEWTATKTGTFRGGYYLDTTINGQGCEYKTTAHNAQYHDYSTGFRCCK